MPVTAFILFYASNSPKPPMPRRHLQCSQALLNSNTLYNRPLPEQMESF